MKEFLLGIYIGLGVVGLVAFIFLIIALIYFLAKNNIFFTFVQEGTAKAILKFGRFHRVIMTYESYALDQQWKVQEEGKEGQEQTDIRETAAGKVEEKYKIKLRKKPRTLFGGLRWVGIPLIRSVYRYNFRWVSFEQAEEEDRLIQKTIAHKERIDSILVQDDVYFSFVRESETKGMVPVDVDMLLTIRIVNPYKALFRVQNWLEATQNQIKPALRGYIAEKEFEELIAKKEEVEREVDEFLRSSGIDEYLERNYGVRLKKVGIVHIDPSGERGQSYVEAASKRWEAEKEKEKVEKIADAEVGRIDRVYTKIQSYGQDGLFIRATEAIEEAGKGPSNLVIFPFGSITSMIEGWLGRKKEVK